MGLFNFKEEDRLKVFLVQYDKMDFDKPPIPILQRLAKLRNEESDYNWKQPDVNAMELYMQSLIADFKWGDIIEEATTEEDALWQMIINTDINVAIGLFNKFAEDRDGHILELTKENLTNLITNMEVTDVVTMVKNVAPQDKFLHKAVIDEESDIREWRGYTEEGIVELLTEYDISDELYDYIMETYGEEVYKSNEVNLSVDHYVNQELLWMPTEYLYYYYRITQNKRLLPTLKVSTWFTRYDTRQGIPTYVWEHIAEAMNTYMADDFKLHSRVISDFVASMTYNKSIQCQGHPMTELKNIITRNKFTALEIVDMLEDFDSKDLYFALYGYNNKTYLSSFSNETNLPEGLEKLYWDYMKAKGALYFKDVNDYSDALYEYFKNKSN